MKYYGVGYSSGDYWGTRLVNIVDALINTEEQGWDHEYAVWSDYHNAYKITPEPTEIEVVILTCYGECNRIVGEEM